MQKSENIGELAKALSIVQSKLEGAKKDAENPFFKAKYADLSSVWDACRQLLADNGLSVVQTFTYLDTEMPLIIDTTLLHSSGEWITGQLAMKPAKEDPQGYGSAITYARRYALSAIVGVAPEDDDAEGATQRSSAKTSKPKPVESITEQLKAQCNTLGWGQEEWKAYVAEKYGKEKLSQLTDEEKQTALFDLKTMAKVKEVAGENPKLLPES